MKIVTIIWTILCIIFTVIVLPNSGFTKRDTYYYQKLCEESGAVITKTENGSYYEGGIGDYCDTSVILARASTPESAIEQFRTSHINISPFVVQKIDNSVYLTKGVVGSIDPFMIIIMFFVWFIPLVLLAGVIKTLRFLTRK